jgi:nucleoside-diphosphate-sugar epimerase
MRILVTGATGLVGNALAKRLCERGDAVRALVRDPSKAAAVLPAAVDLRCGDITAAATLRDAMQDVDLVFHAAGMPEQWQKDDSIFDVVNRQGTANVMAAALAAGVRRVVYTSTMDVFAAPSGGTLVETNVDPHPKHTAYERSKQAAEKEAEAARAKGLEVVFLNPCAVYGPSPVLGTLNALIRKLLNREVPMLPPGGMPVVYIDGVVDAHIAAAERGGDGERYLLGDAFLSMQDIAAETVRIGGLKKIPGNAPLWLLQAVATISAPLARVFGFTPLVSPGELTFLQWQPRVDSSKAMRQLGFVPTAVSTGFAKTIEFLRRGLP